MKKLEIDVQYLRDILFELLKIPSPSGYTDQIVHFVAKELQRFNIPVELTRRGAIRADLAGKQPGPQRAVISHLDTLGAIVKRLKPNGRIELVPIGSWNARFAEGARVTIFREKGASRGTILPMKASGHVFNEGVDAQTTAWTNLEVRVDEKSFKKSDLLDAGFHVGDFVAIDPSPEMTENGYINSRHLDDKAGVATMLTLAKAVTESKVELPVNCHLLFTISEEVGSGASAVLHGDVAEMVTIDNSTVAPGQESLELGVTIAMMDSTGPFDYHLTRKLIGLAETYSIPFARDVFKYYRSDSASAIEAGNDIRTALVCFGLDGSHGWERTHIDSLIALTDLLTLYVQSPPTAKRDFVDLGPLAGLPTQPGPTFDQLPQPDMSIPKRRRTDQT